MKASLKKQFQKFQAANLVGKTLRAIHRETMETMDGEVTTVTNKIIEVTFTNRFETYSRQFRRDTATQMGGPLRLEVEQILKEH